MAEDVDRSPLRHRAVVSSLAVVTSGQLPVFLTGALAVQVREDLGFSASGLGLAIGVFFVASAAMSAPLGRVAQRVGSSAGMRAGVLASAVSLAGIAGLSRTWWTLAALLVVGGAGNALSQPAANLALTRAVPRERQGLVFGIKQTAIPLATLLGGLSVPAIAVTVGWRWTYVGAALGAVIASLTTPPHNAPALRPRPVVRRGAVAAGDRGTLQLRALVLISAAGGLGAMVGNTLGTFLVSSAVDGGVQPAAAGLLLALGSVVGLTMRVVSGWSTDRGGVSPLTVMTAMLAAGAVGCALLGATGTLPLLLGTVLGFGAGWGWPGLLNLAVVRIHPALPALATGITQTGVYVGAALGPAVTGFVIDHAGYTAGWLTTAGLALTAATFTVLGARRVRTAGSSERITT